jgi:hypothetical protein
MVTQISAHLNAVNSIPSDPNLKQFENDLKAYLQIMQACQVDINNGGAISQAHLAELASVLKNLQGDMGNMEDGSVLDRNIAQGSGFNALSYLFGTGMDGLPSQFDAANEGKLDDLNQVATLLIDEGDLSNIESTIQNFISNPLH